MSQILSDHGGGGLQMSTDWPVKENRVFSSQVKTLMFYQRPQITMSLEMSVMSLLWTLFLCGCRSLDPLPLSLWRTNAKRLVCAGVTSFTSRSPPHIDLLSSCFNGWLNMCEQENKMFPIWLLLYFCFSCLFFLLLSHIVMSPFVLMSNSQYLLFYKLINCTLDSDLVTNWLKNITFWYKKNKNKFQIISISHQSAQITSDIYL